MSRKITRLGYDESIEESERESSQTPSRSTESATEKKTRGRKRASPKVKIEQSSDNEDEISTTNGKKGGNSKTSKKGVNGNNRVKDHRVDDSGKLEFGGVFGVTSMMIGFPLLMYYMWIGATYYDGKFPRAAEGQSMSEFLTHLGHLVYEGAFPTAKAWAIYWSFFIFEGACYVLLPGVQVSGRPLPHLGGKQLPYYCSGVWSFYTSIILVLALHFSGIFKLYTVIDEFGSIMSVAILSGFIVSFVAYFSALARGAQHRMSGYAIYDFFMGAELNPRMFGILDFKMFFEVRLPWYILLFISMAAATKQYEQYGYVSGEVWFLVMAHYLYANACSKGEECIVSTWYGKQ